MSVDWRKRAGYIRARHAVEPAWADEAVSDEFAVWLIPDPASRSGTSVRVVGYSVSAGDLLVVILLHPSSAPDDAPDGDWWGANAWLAGPRERRLYGKWER